MFRYLPAHCKYQRDPRWPKQYVLGCVDKPGCKATSLDRTTSLKPGVELELAHHLLGCKSSIGACALM